MAGRGSGAFRRTKRRGNLTLAEFCGTVANWYEFYIRGNRRRLFVFVALIVRNGLKTTLFSNPPAPHPHQHHHGDGGGHHRRQY